MSDLLEQAANVPATGSEADDWRARNLAELLLHAWVTGDDQLVAAVDQAAATLPAVFPRFGHRLRTLRGCFGPVPASYPKDRTDSPTPTPWPSEAVRRCATQLARLADACPISTSSLAYHAPPNAQESAAELDQLAAARVLGRTGHRCVDVDVDAALVWREWLMEGALPTLAHSRREPDRGASSVRPGLQLHMGAHLDHLAELTDHSGPAEAARLQFGAGLLVAESVAMTNELIALAGGADLGPVYLSALCQLAVDRLTRLPGVSEWGVAMLPDSATMAAAARTTNQEFTALPTLAATYVSGPFTLAERGFADPLIPPRLRSALETKWHATVGSVNQPPELG